MEYAIVTVSEKSLFARLIQLFTWSKWNHVAFYIKSFYLNGVQQKDVIVEINLKGVNFYSLKSYAKNKTVRLHKKTPKINLGQALGFIMKNKHRKYDFLRTIFFFYKPKDLNSQDKWNCIEFVEEIFRDQDIELFDRKLTPAQINKLLSSEEDLEF